MNMASFVPGRNIRFTPDGGRTRIDASVPANFLRAGQHIRIEQAAEGAFIHCIAPAAAGNGAILGARMCNTGPEAIAAGDPVSLDKPEIGAWDLKTALQWTEDPVTSGRRSGVPADFSFGIALEAIATGAVGRVQTAGLALVECEFTHVGSCYLVLGNAYPWFRTSVLHGHRILWRNRADQGRGWALIQLRDGLFHRPSYIGPFAVVPDGGQYAVVNSASRNPWSGTAGVVWVNGVEFALPVIRHVGYNVKIYADYDPQTGEACVGYENGVSTHPRYVTLADLDSNQELYQLYHGGIINLDLFW